MFVILLLAVLAIVLADGMPLIKSKQWAAFAVFASVLAAACVLFLAKSAGLAPPLKALGELLSGCGQKLFG